jgi:L-aspartate oxidase
MLALHADAELAPRDVVARAIWQQLQMGHRPMLDARQTIGEKFTVKYPMIMAVCRDAGLDPMHDLLPVAPAAHYQMGGVAMNNDGRSSVDHLWVCGEVAASHIHGANRLASNSLLEALVYGEIIAQKIIETSDAASTLSHADPLALKSFDKQKDQTIRSRLRGLMYVKMGLQRDEKNMHDAMRSIIEYQRNADLSYATRAMILVAGMMTLSAIMRKESRGAHARSDYPNLSAQAIHSQITMAQFIRTMEDQYHQPWIQ